MIITAKGYRLGHIYIPQINAADKSEMDTVRHVKGDRTYLDF